MNKKSGAMSAIIVVMLALPVLGLLFVNSMQPVLSAPMIPAPSKALVACPPTCFSYNWGGYAVISTTGAVTDVKGSWKVAAWVGSLCNANEWYDASFWTGIDGWTSKTVEQIGTATDCYEGVLYYFAWYEFYPAASVTISSVPISPGNIINAEVKYSSLKFTATITDVTTGKSFSTPATKVSGAKESSAEWISESAFGLVGELPLSNFGTAYWGFDNTAVSGTNYATVKGVTGTILSFGSQVASVEEVCYPSGLPDKATPSALSVDGTSFTMTWVNPGPQG